MCINQSFSLLRTYFRKSSWTAAIVFRRLFSVLASLSSSSTTLFSASSLLFFCLTRFLSTKIFLISIQRYLSFTFCVSIWAFLFFYISILLRLGFQSPLQFLPHQKFYCLCFRLDLQSKDEWSILRDISINFTHPLLHHSWHLSH